ncbi:alpha/beta hydrolase [Aliikangiella coralliicola]|nr:alpha/beta hydrolase-fold protein [Aliikangiella coralliicola]
MIKLKNATICKYVATSVIFLSVLFTQLSRAESAIPPLTVELGTKYQISSKALEQERTLFVRLPKNYDKSKKSYPVVYVLDANSFFSGNIYQEAVALITRIEATAGIPETIVVGIQSNEWYKDVIVESEPFEAFVNREVPAFIDGKFRTLPNRVLVGHSYAGAFVSGALPVDSKSFNLFLSLSPIYPSLAFIEKVQNRYANLKPLSARLHIIDGDENPIDKLMLKEAASKLDKNVLSFEYHSMPMDSHMSVFTVGLNHGLRKHFSDYRLPARADLKTKNFDIAELKQYLKNRDLKYGTVSKNEFIQDAFTSMAHKYTSMNRLDLAIPYWQLSKTRFKEYFMGGYADRFVKMGDRQSAIILWQEMRKLFPNSDKDYQSLLKKHRKHNVH